MSHSDEDEKRIGLAEAIGHLRTELSAARRAGEGQDVRFAVGEIEVELALEFGKSREAGGGFKLFSFVDVSGKAGATGKDSHRVKLKLTIDTAGNPRAGVIADHGVAATIKPPGAGG